MGLSIISGFALGLTEVNFEVDLLADQAFSSRQKEMRENYDRLGVSKPEELFLPPFIPPSKVPVHNRNTPAAHSGSEESQQHPRAVLTGAQSSKRITLLYSVPVRQHLGSGSSFGPLQYRKNTNHLAWAQWGAPKLVGRALLLWEEAEGLGLVQPGEEMALGRT